MTNDPEASAQVSSRRSRLQIPLLLALVLACALPIVFPGDAPWIFDEPKLLRAAEIANHTPADYFGMVRLPFTLLSAGLSGNRGAIYGPAAEWFYQIMLAVLPHDLVLLAAVRAGIVTVVTAGGLFWLSRATGLSMRFAVAIMLSPWLWFYARQLWDNSFCIPLSVLTLAAYAEFIKSHGRGSLTLAIVGMVFLALLHLMALAFIAPMILHLIFFQTRWLIRFRRPVLLTCALMGVVSFPYIANFIAYFNPGLPPGLSPWRGWLFPLLGAHHLSAIGLGDLLGSDWISRTILPMPYFLNAAVWLSGIIYPAVWIGMILAVARARRVVKRSEDCTVLDHVACISIGIWIFQTFLDGMQRVYDMPHYYNATWVAYAVFAWLAVDALPRRSIQAIAISVYAACQFTVIACLLLQIHINGGNLSTSYGPTIANQQQIADDVGNDTPDFRFRQWQQVPVGYEAIKTLRPSARAARFPGHPIRIEYRNAFPGDARIIMLDPS